MSVYTRTGDKGKTSLYGGKRVSKGSLRVEAYGSVDELNSVIGAAIAQIKDQKSPASPKLQRGEKIKNELIKIQNDLFEIGAALANPSSKIQKLTSRVTEFENIIDRLETNVPPLFNFILPGGGRTGSLLHLARTVSRRAERRIVELSENPSANSGQGVQPEITVYMNRLSDLLFMFARFINHKEKKKEIIWKSR